MKHLKKFSLALLLITIGCGFIFQVQGPPKQLTSFPIFHRTGYTLAYDTRFKVPFWTYERLTKENLVKAYERKNCEFQVDADLYAPHQSSLADYVRSGFDRGHLVPAADLAYSEKGLQETFLLSNITPQHPALNRGLWAQLERSLRQLAKETAWVDIISGPLFLAHKTADGKQVVTFEVIGKNHVAVPTHFFKVVITPDRSWAYLIPNQEVKGTLGDYVSSLKTIEQLAGIKLPTSS